MKGVRRVKKTRRNRARHQHTQRVKGGENGSITSSTTGTINNWNKELLAHRNRTRHEVVSSRPPNANKQEANERLQQLHRKTAKNFELHNKLEKEGVPTYFIPAMKESYRKGFHISNV